MDERERQVHLTASREAGRESACGKKIDHGTEERAVGAARALTEKYATNGDTKELEAYPCYWCHGWHIGRKLTAEGRIATVALIAEGGGV